MDGTGGLEVVVVNCYEHELFDRFNCNSVIRQFSDLKNRIGVKS